MKQKLIIILSVLCGFSAFSFSPYENYLQSGRQTHVAVIASANDGQAEALGEALRALNEKKAGKALRKVDISNVSSFSKKLQGKTWYMVYFDYDGDNYLEAVRAFESVAAVQALQKLIEPHPRAREQNAYWLQMEWINYIHGAKPGKTPPGAFAMVTRLKPEKEAEYRGLHQTTWPGTVDRMTRMQYHDFSIFLIELGDELYEFFYVEFVGTDAGKDKMSSLSDPVYQRWISYTDPCQNPLPDADGIWSMMNTISK